MAVLRVERWVPSAAGAAAGRTRVATEPVVVVLEPVDPVRVATLSSADPALCPSPGAAVLVASGWDAHVRLGTVLRAAVRSGVRRWVLWVRRTRQAIGPPSSHLRQRSSAECHVRASAGDVAATLGACPRTDRLELLGPPGPIGADPSEGVRAPGRLHVRWSWPAVPVWVSVRPWSAGRSVVGIAIRGGRRPRYPRRYFGVCHRALHELRAVVQEVGGPA